MVSAKHLVIGQSGGATAVINASLVGAIRAAKESAEIDGIYGARFGIQGVLDKQVVDLRTLCGAGAGIALLYPLGGAGELPLPAAGG